VAGDRLQVLGDEKSARAQSQAYEIAARRQERPEVSLDDVFAQFAAGATRELNVIVKTDVQGSIEPIVASLERLSEEGITVKVVLSGTGNITESDVMLAAASGAIVVGFNVRVETGARRLADTQRVDIRFYSVIYELVDDVRAALTGMLAPKFAEIVYGHAEVRQIFRVGRTQAAGCYVTDGTIHRNNQVRVLRDGAVLFAGRLAALRRFKDDAREVTAGYECGMSVDGFNDFQEGDVIESFGKEQV
jgi:translation initiation factor IF-2